MKKITVAKALKLKNEIVGEINKLKASIVAHNLYDNRNPARSDTVSAFNKLNGKIVDLITVKTAIANANVAIHEAIYAKSEAASLLEFLATVSTADGVTDSHGFGTSDRVITMVAQVNATKVEETSANLQKKISQLQDGLDEFNHKTLIEVPDHLV